MILSFSLAGFFMPANRFVEVTPYMETSGLGRIWYSLLHPSEQAFMGDTSVQPNAIKTYTYVLTSGHPCDGIANTQLAWIIRKEGGGSAGGKIISSDHTASSTCVGAYCGYLKYQFPSSGSIEFKVVATCSKGSLSEYKTVKIQSSCTAECSSGQSRCKASMTSQACQLVNGCWIWGNTADCASDEYCGTDGRCHVKNQCVFGQIKCKSLTSYVKCENRYEKGFSFGSTLFYVSGNYQCRVDKIVYVAPDRPTPPSPEPPDVPPEEDLCANVVCDDEDACTVDTCEAGECVFDAVECGAEELCAFGACVEGVCEVLDMPCEGAVWKDYPDCKWSDDVCNPECDLECGEGEQLDATNCVCTQIVPCVSNSDCMKTEVCEGEVCVVPDSCGSGKLLINEKCYKIQDILMPLGIGVLLVASVFLITYYGRKKKGGK